MIAIATNPGAREWLTPPEIARERGVKPAKVINWIVRGELQAVNHANSHSSRPRWRVSRTALQAFDAARSNNTAALEVRPQRRRSSHPDVIAFF